MAPVNAGLRDSTSPAPALTAGANGKGPGLRITDALNAPIPADCRHGAGALKDGELPGLPAGEGSAYVRLDGEWVVQPVLADLTNDGASELVSVLQCDAGGVGWPHRLLVHGPNLKLLHSFSLGDVTPAEHGSFSSVEARGGDVFLAWGTYEGCCGDKKTWTARLHWDGMTFALEDLEQLTGSRAPGRWVMPIFSGPSAFMTASGNIACLFDHRDTTSSVACELREGDFGPTTPPRPTRCDLEWGRRILLDERAAFVCHGGALAAEALLGTDSTDWFDPTTDLTIRTPAGEAAALHPVSTFDNYSISCTIEREAVSCANERSGASFRMTSDAFSVSN